MPLSELSDVTLQVGDQKGGTESLLRAAGALDNLPYKVAFSTFTSGPPQIEAATAGKIDFAITGNTPPIFGAASNAKVKVVSAYDGGGSGDQILVHADSPIHVDRRSARQEHRGRQGQFRARPHPGPARQGRPDAGRRRSWSSCSPPTRLSAFTQRQVDAWAIWDPYTAQADAQIPGAQHRAGQGRHQRLLVRRRLRCGAGRPEAQHRAERFAGALREGRSRWAQDNPEEWAQELRGRSRSGSRRSPSVSQGRSLRLPTELVDELVASEQKLADLFAESEQIARRAEIRPTGSTAATTTRCIPC